MTAPASSRTHTDAAVLAIEALATLEGSPLLVGRGVQPGESGWQGDPGELSFRPYVVVFPSPGVPYGALADPVEYLDYRAQATCVGATQEGAEAVADLVKAAWVNAPLPISGRFSYRGQMIVDNPIIRDDADAPPVHYAVLQVIWRTQAA